MPLRPAPKQARAKQTRLRLLESAVDRLAENGWAATTVADISKHAQATRGAAGYYFPTRADLVTAAVAEIVESRMLDIVEAARSIDTDEPDGLRTVVRYLFDAFASPLFKAALHLVVAAVGDHDLRHDVTTLQKRIGRATHTAAASALNVDDSDPATHRLVQATLDLARGLALADLLTDDTERRHSIADQWAASLESSVLRRPTSTRNPPEPSNP
ncbi:TetR/AcrR family transcriptional regulator [Nocardia sp. NPDC059246]|uniref:TetR/AcrR family transcriptional regulator n=1 Tax=unclassified Nocardia TaxID=2637762 RepID=UPI00367EDCDA